MRKKKLVANWKLNADYVSMTKFANNISEVDSVDLLVAPSTIGLVPAINLFRKKSTSVIAQNVNLVTVGNHTGSTSWIELKDYGIKTVIVGHPEVINDFKESDTTINKKTRALLENGMKVVLCIEESRTDLDSVSTKENIRTKIKRTLHDINKNYFVENLIIVYKPTFTEQKNVAASAKFIIDTIKIIRIFLREEFGFYVGNNISILYGGDFSSDDIEEIASSKHLDGFFVDDEKAISAKYVNILLKYLYKYSTEDYVKYYDNNILISEPLESDRSVAQEINLAFDEYEIDNDVYFKNVKISEEEI